MKKINNLISALLNSLSSAFSVFPVTAALMLAANALIAISISIDDRALNAFITEKAVPALALASIGAFFCELRFEKSPARRWAGIVLSAIVACAMVFLTALSGELFHGTSVSLIKTITERQIAFWLIACAALGLHAALKRSGTSISTFLAILFQRLLKLGILCGILNLGVMAVCGIFILLILNSQGYDFMFQAAYFIGGSVFILGGLSAFLNPDEEIQPFFRALILYILLPLLISAFAVIYAYIGKIFITGVMPSNEVFRILSALFVVGVPVWTMAEHFSEKPTLRKISSLLPYFFIPFLFLQSYAIGLRITANGLTPARCFSVAFILFEIIYLAVYRLRSHQTGVMLPVAAGFALVLLSLPGVNVYQLSFRNQKAILTRYPANELAGLPDDMRGKIRGAYDYLKDDEQGKALLRTIDPDLLSAAAEIDPTLSADAKTLYFYADFPIANLDISGFRSVSSVHSDKYVKTDSPQVEILDLSKVELYEEMSRPFSAKDETPQPLDPAEPAIFVDLKEIAASMFACAEPDCAHEIAEGKIPQCVELDENARLCFQHVSVNGKSLDQVESFSLGGLLFRK